MKISTGLGSRALLAAAVASTMMLAACGGGGSEDATGGAASTVPPPKFACVNVPGASDAAQSQINNTLVPQLGAVPAAGATVQQMFAAMSQLLDVADAVANGLQAMAGSQDVMQLTTTVENAAAALRCALAPASLALAGLQAQLPVGTSIPNIASADALLAQIAAMLDAKLGNSLGSGLPNGLDLTVLRGLLQQLNAQLASVSSQVQTKLPANTPAAPVINMLSLVMVDVQRVFGRIAVLDDAGVADAITFLVTDVSTRMTATLASTLGVPAISVLGPQTALNNALVTLTSQLAFGGTPVVLSQLHYALIVALGPLLGLVG